MDLVYLLFFAFTTVGKLSNFPGLLNLLKPKEKTDMLVKLD